MNITKSGTLRNFLFFCLVAVCLGGCATEAVKPSESANTETTFLDEEQVTNHISGNTEEWSKGAGYYSTDGKLEGIWENASISGTWSVKADGKLCIAVAAWGGKEECHRYENKNGKTHLVFEGNSRYREVKPGNQLDSFK